MQMTLDSDMEGSKMSEYEDIHGDIPGGMTEQTMNQRLRTYFDGRIVRKDLTKAIK